MDKYINVKDILANTLNVDLVAISKYQSITDVENIKALGVKNFGENKVQDFLKKYDLIKDVNWHFVGQLQTNKAKYLIGKVNLIQSLDSLKLAQEINKHSVKNNSITSCLIQIKFDDDISRGGINVDSLPTLFDECLKLKGIKIKGFMVVPPLVEEEGLIEIFKRAKEIFNKYQVLSNDISYLSMGMSSDYKLAIKYGANMVRIGQKLFEKGNDIV